MPGSIVVNAALAEAFDRLARGEHATPHDILGAHPAPGGWSVRIWKPEAAAVVVLTEGGERVETTQVHPAGVFMAELAGDPNTKPHYRLEVRWPSGDVTAEEDPYRFWPTLGDVDLHLFGEGRHQRLWTVLGAHAREHEGAYGTAFAVWAPSARNVRVVGDFNFWDGRRHPMRALGSSGVWELFVPDVGVGSRYKYEIVTAEGHLTLKADPMARAAELPPATASVVTERTHQWNDDAWMSARGQGDWMNTPIAIYEVHAGSWRQGLNWIELAHQLADHCSDFGFTHVELLPIAEHPFGGSWGYQVTSYYAPTARYGYPDDFRAFVDILHQRGIGVIIDWVPAHFPRDEWALARFDGTALYEHLDPRQGEHPDWGTLVFNYGRNEVRNFLVANALYWLEEFHVDGLRVDAVASMVYLDYSRKPGEWVPNQYGGRENLDAVAFLREMNTVVHANHPGVLTIAEESTAWPAVSRPVEYGGLGFTHKWNMGWMHDTLAYLQHDPIHRRWHHRELTFGLLYAFTENFVLPLSHDEVVHGKGPLLDKMAGDRWQQFANLRALYGWMWAYPGKKLLFMGGEIAQDREWHHDRSIDWHLLDSPSHGGVANLVRHINHSYRQLRALWSRDHDPSGFRWLEADDADHSVYAFFRLCPEGAPPVVCVTNFTPAPREAYRVGLPAPGRWRVALDTDRSEFGGTGQFSIDGLDAEPIPWHGQEWSAEVPLPPLATLWLTPAE